VFGNLTATQQTTLRFNLGQAVNTTIALAGSSLDSTTVGALVPALNSVVGSAANVDAELFTLLLTLVQKLATLAGSAASSFLAIIAAMIQARGVGSNSNAATLSDSLSNLALSVLADAVCGQAPANISAGGINLQASFQSSFANNSVTLGGGALLQFGSDFGAFNPGDTISDSVCKKNQIVSQSVAPFVPPVNGAFMYVGAHFDGRRGRG
jgi:hypothetical protein